jgi:hypothetical protein
MHAQLVCFVRQTQLRYLQTQMLGYREKRGVRGEIHRPMNGTVSLYRINCGYRYTDYLRENSCYVYDMTTGCLEELAASRT